ncbi:unnamed protein product [Soboliphyme baturini]|uniref:CDC73_N domain-containing protein n=1 Tax=Soboliphyme baturini TaxID=241478 RepID=A0A183IL97_9BILA|nr:unnamed protein product [Soboliphyme baturini]
MEDEDESTVFPGKTNGYVVEQVKFKFHGVVLTGDGKFEEEIDRRPGVASGVLDKLYRTTVTTNELSLKPMLAGLMADPLNLLKDYIISAKPVKEKDDYIIFGDTAFPKSAKTSYRVYNKRDEYYTLESLYYFYKKRALAHTAYVREAAAKNIQVVTRPDRKLLEDYLTKDKLERFPVNIDLSAPIPQSIPVSRLQNELENQAESKRMRYDEEEQVRKEKERILAILERSSGLSVAKSEGVG